MTDEQLRTRIADLLVEHFEVPREKVTGDATFRRTLGLDSLDVVDFVWFVHEAFGYKAELAEYRDLQTVDGLVAFVRSKVG